MDAPNLPAEEAKNNALKKRCSSLGNAVAQGFGGKQRSAEDSFKAQGERYKTPPFLGKTVLHRLVRAGRLSHNQ